MAGGQKTFGYCTKGGKENGLQGANTLCHQTT